MKRSTPKTIFAIIFSLYFLWCAYEPANAVLLHIINLPIHEAGHVIFRILGEFMGVAGGSLFQIIVPIVFFGYFIWHKKPFSASIVLFWVGNNFLDVFVYANDAITMQLPLLSGLTGNEGGFHDWNYLLVETGSLAQTPVVAKILRFTGTVITFTAILGSVIFAREDEEIVSDMEL